MRFANLKVVHISKRKVKALDLTFATQLEGFHLDTCQRWIWVSTVSAGKSLQIPGAETFNGMEAYLFLLKLATGLQSEILGETDIFGQIKEAWRKIEATQCLELLELTPLFSRLFEDTKEIRSRYLQNLGGASYGSLVRKLIQNNSRTGPQGATLLIGAGKIAQSIAPFLLDSELWIWNRNPARLESFMAELKSKLTSKEFSKIRVLKSKKEELDAWKIAAHSILCVPVDTLQDIERAAFWQKGSFEGRSVIHLGGHRSNCPAWASLPKTHFVALDDLFALQKSLGHLRSVQIAQAIRACQERAKLRALGSSISIPHGWEDLACFA